MLYSAAVRLARLLFVAAALLGGCNGGGGDRNDNTLPPRASTTSTSVDYSVPAVIDVAYVEKVMEALDHVYGDAIRILAREREITKEFLEHLAAIYTPSEFDLAQQLWVRDAASGLKELAPNPGDPTTDVRRLIRADRACVVAHVYRDFGATRRTTRPRRDDWYIALVPFTGRSPLNPTPWKLSFDGFKSDGTEPAEPCVTE